MNWVKMIVFLIFIYYFYLLAGSKVNKLVGLKNNDFTQNILSGFLFITAIQWLIGFPSQFFHISWKSYYYILLIIYVVLFLFLMKNRIKERIDIFTFFKNYWFIFVLVICFSFWSMSSQLPYFQLNYDDGYYLGAIVQQIGSESLASVNYFNGTPMELGISRLVNTFEINYGFWSQTFFMDATFFARAAMVFHNYLLVFFSLFACIKSFTNIHDEKVQFICSIFSFFLIPAGYADRVLDVHLYDGWQFNTAIWYGGSLVRLISIPVGFYYIKSLIDQFNIKKLIFTGMVFLAFLSLSSIFITFAICIVLMGMFYILLKLIQTKDKKFVFLSVFLFVMILCGMKIVPKLLEYVLPSLTNYYQNAIPAFNRNLLKYTDKNYVFLAVSLVSIFLLKYRKDKTLPAIGLILSICCIVLYSGFFNKFSLLASIGFDFVFYRLICGLQIFLIMILSVYIVLFFQNYICKRFILPSVSIVFLIFVNIFNMIKLEEYANNYNWITTGLSPYGYNPDRVFHNQYMQPLVFHDMQEYFDGQENRHHRVIAPLRIKYEDGVIFFTEYLASASNRIESVISFEGVRCDDLDFGTLHKLAEFCNGNIPYEEVEGIIKKHVIEYAVVINPSVKDDLIRRGKEVVMDSESLANDHVYLIKLL